MRRRHRLKLDRHKVGRYIYLTYADVGIIRCGVAGARGKMGRVAVEALSRADGIEYVGGLIRPGTPESKRDYDDVGEFLSKAKPDVVIDFTVFPDSKALALACIGGGVRPVIGTSGYAPADVEELCAACARTKTGAVFAPNFALGAVLMMKFAQEAARHYATAEIVEMHEAGKKDAPSGTAMATARRVAGVRRFERPPTEVARAPGARGASVEGVGVHSLRVPGVVAHQEVLFGGDGETLAIRHDSYARTSFMPGVLLAVRAVVKLDRLVEGLEELL